jgi:Novel STAND NTPase 1
MAAEARNRYPGAHPFEDDDLSRKLFRGREQETTSLTRQILANRLIVLYARSGLGKTSLLNAGIAENLRADGLVPLAVRVNDIALGPLESIYNGIMTASAKQQLEYIPGDKQSLWYFFKTAEFWKGDLLQTPVLILDQFEELFTLHSQDQRGAFIDQLSHLVRGVPPSKLPSEVMDKDGRDALISKRPPQLKILISLREDFLPYLEEFSDRIPEILDQRFRLLPLRRDAASRALEEPAKVEHPNLTTRPFELESSGREEILNFLAHRAPSEIKKLPTDIEPFQLQLICQHIEEIAEIKQRRGGQNAVTITVDEIGDWSSLQKILEKFYVTQVQTIASFRQRWAVRRLCTEFLVSPEGRRLKMEASEIKRRVGVHAATLKALVDHRLLRADQTPEGTYYELSHDSLIKPILASKYWSFLWRTAASLVSGILSLFFALTLTIALLFMPFSPQSPTDDTMVFVISLLVVGLLGSMFWSVGVRSFRKFNEMRRRSAQGSRWTLK